MTPPMCLGPGIAGRFNRSLGFTSLLLTRSYLNTRLPIGSTGLDTSSSSLSLMCFGIIEKNADAVIQIG